MLNCYTLFTLLCAMWVTYTKRIVACMHKCLLPTLTSVQLSRMRVVCITAMHVCLSVYLFFVSQNLNSICHNIQERIWLVILFCCKNSWINIFLLEVFNLILKQMHLHMTNQWTTLHVQYAIHTNCSVCIHMNSYMKHHPIKVFHTKFIP